MRKLFLKTVFELYIKKYDAFQLPIYESPEPARVVLIPEEIGSIRIGVSAVRQTVWDVDTVGLGCQANHLGCRHGRPRLSGKQSGM